MFAIRLVFCTLSRRPSPVAKKRSRALSLNDRITSQCKPIPYNCQELPYSAFPHRGAVRARPRENSPSICCRSASEIFFIPSRLKLCAIDNLCERGFQPRTDLHYEGLV